MQHTFPVMRSNKFSNAIKTLTIFAGLSYTTLAFALPVVDQVAVGDVNIAQPEANAMQINQISDKAIVNWDSFNIDAQESVKFQQPSSSSICLNRINAEHGMSNIAGQLSSNGQIMLVNGAGILVSEGAQVNLGSLVASVQDIADDAFMSGKISFGSDANAAIINRGVIEVDNMAVLFGSNVVDAGVIHAKTGKVVIASGSKISMDFIGDGMMNFVLEPTTKSSVDENNAQLADGVAVSGKIINDNGEVFILGKGVSGVFDNLINMSGEVRATEVATTNDGGKIMLMGDDNGTVKISGVVDSSGKDPKACGGIVVVHGSKIDLTETANIDASGDVEGGFISVGSPMAMKFDKLEFPATDSLTVAPGAILNASAISEGDAGHVLVAASKDNTFGGTVLARGGNMSGNGGNIGIVSMHSTPVVDTTVAQLDVSAPNGHEGEAAIESIMDKIQTSLADRTAGDITSQSSNG